MSTFLRTIYFAVILLSFILLGFSCSDNNEFVIRGQIKDLGHQGVKISYYAVGGIKTMEEIANNGKFEFRAVSSNPTLVTLSKVNGGPLAYLIVKNGDEVTVKGETADLYAISVKGNRPSSDMAKFMADNAVSLRNGSKEEVNRAVADYIRTNPSSPAAGALLVTRFYTPGHEMQADSLLRILTPEGRPISVMQNYGVMLGGQVSSDARANLNAIAMYAGGDTLARLIPSRQSYMMLVFIGSDKRQRDSITPWLRLFADSLPRRRFKSLEISMVPDSVSWSNTIKGDSANWSQGWAPGGASMPQIRKLNVASEPFFIVCDSTGSQLYRGTSLTSATDILRQRLHVTGLKP